MRNSQLLNPQLRRKDPFRRTNYWIQLSFAIFGICFYQGAFVESIRYLRGQDHLLAGQTEIAGTISQAIIMAGTAIGLWYRREEVRRTWPQYLPYIVIIALCGVSALWSSFPFPTVRRTVTLSVCVFFGVWCQLVFGLWGSLKLISRTTLALGVCSIIVLVALPSVGRETALGYESAMRGVFAQKNGLGVAMLLAITCLLYEVMVSRRHWIQLSAMIFFALLCEAMAKSATSILISLLVILLAMFQISRRNWRLYLAYWFGVASVTVFLTFMLTLAPDDLFHAINRDPTLTGRLPLWQLAIKAAMARPLLGYGYSGFWSENSRLVQYIWNLIDWQAPSAHNGYLDIVLQIGLVGLLIYVVTWIYIIAVSWRARHDLPDAKWILLFMCVNILINIDEGPLPYPDQFTLLMPGTLMVLSQWRLHNKAKLAQKSSRITEKNRQTIAMAQFKS